MIPLSRIFKSKKYAATPWSESVRFAVVWSPLFEYVFLKLLEIIQSSQHCSRLMSTERLRQSIRDNLLPCYQSMAERVLILEMHMAKKNGYLKGKTATERFDYFIEQLKNPENAVLLFKKYKVLSSKIRRVTQHYLETWQELLIRLDQDYIKISDYFFDLSHYQLQTILTSGDKHRQGRSVAILTFVNGQQQQKLVYKPRSLAVDRAFQNLLEWFNLKSDIKLRTLKLLLGENYGWCEYIENDCCENRDGIKQFYQRLGAWLSLTYLLRGSDFHAENIIACRDHPVIIDYECFFTPWFRTEQTEKSSLPRYFVYDTCFLPMQTLMDMSALNAGDTQDSYYYTLRWLDEGTDSMRAVRVKKKIQPAKNRPKLLNEPLNPEDFEHEFIAGFQQSYQVLLNNLNDLLNDNSPLLEFKEATIRVVLRNTRDYSKLLTESYHPQLMFDHEKFIQHFSWLKQGVKDFPYLKDLISSEIEELSVDNIPVFFCQSDGDTVFDGSSKKTPIQIVKSGFQCMKEHIRTNINLRDLAIQTALIKNSFTAIRLNNDHSLPEFNAEFPFIQNQALILARRELEKLAELYIINNGRIFWPTIGYKNSGLYLPCFTDIHLYEGISGIGLSFAYGAKIFNHSEFEYIARQCMSSLRRTLAEKSATCLTGVGGFNGVGGLLYTFAVFYRLWQDETLKADINALLYYLPELIENDNTLDVIGGSAGCMAGLFSLQGIISDSNLMHHVQLCVQRILDCYPQPNQLPFQLSSEMTKPLLGFSHGVMGYAWALAKYYSVCKNEKVAEWIQAALAYEREAFNQLGYWPDFRHKKSSFLKNESPVYWCHGAAGIGLAKLGINKSFQDSQLPQEIHKALQITEQQGFKDYQDLCHGNLGNLELFLSAHSDRYEKLATAVVQFIKINGARTRLASSPEAAPGLMTGSAGIAYQLLRIARPETVPSILTLAPNI